MAQARQRSSPGDTRTGPFSWPVVLGRIGPKAALSCLSSAMKMLSGSPSVAMTWMVRRTDARNSGYMRRWQPPKISLANRVVPLRTACWIWDALNERFQDKQQHDSLPNAFVKSCRSLLQKVKARWHGCRGCRKCSPNANGRRKWVFPPKLVAGFVFVMLVFMQRLR